MKRSPLHRHTPLRRSAKPLKRTPLARKTRLQSATAETKAWRRRYSAALKERKLEQIAARGMTYCTLCEAYGRVEGHHTQGRKRENILVFILACPACHRDLHENGKRSRREGLLK